MTEPNELNTITEVNFTEKKKGASYQVEADAGVPKFLRDMANFAKKQKVKAAFVMTVDETNHVHWFPLSPDEHSTALMSLAMEEARQELIDLVFNEAET